MTPHQPPPGTGSQAGCSMCSRCSQTCLVFSAPSSRDPLQVVGAPMAPPPFPVRSESRSASPADLPSWILFWFSAYSLPVSLPASSFLKLVFQDIDLDFPVLHVPQLQASLAHPQIQSWPLKPPRNEHPKGSSTYAAKFLV